MSGGKRPTCPKCGAEVRLAGAEPVTSCRHCDSSIWVDLGSVLLHTAIEPAVDERAARRLLRAPAGTTRAALVWLPFWAFSRGAAARMVPADSLLRAELDEEPALAGRERPFAGTPEAASAAEPPNVPLAAVLAEDERGATRPRLVHVPFWSFAGAGAVVRLDAVEGRLRVGTSEEPGPLDARLPARFLALGVAFFLAGLAPRPPLGPVVAAAAVALAGTWWVAGPGRPAASKVARR